MKKYKILINVLLACICVLGILCFGLMIDPCKLNLEAWNNVQESLSYEITDSAFVESLKKAANEYWSNFLKFLFTILFSALSAIASAVAAVIFNLRIAKQK